MKLLFVVAALVSADVPLMSTSSVFGLFFDSFQLGKDLSLYAVTSVHQQIPRSGRFVIAQYVAPVFTQYLVPVYESASGLAQKGFAAVYPFVERGLVNLDNRSSGILDSVITEFESSYPESFGKIGKSLFDRLFLLAWLLFLTKVVLALVFAVISFPFRFKAPQRKQMTTPTKSTSTDAPRTGKKRIVITK